MPYLGKTPSQATRKRYYKTASGSETSISGTMTVGGTLTFTDGEFVDVSVNGVALVAGTDYNTDTANTIAGLSALSANDQVEIVVYDTFSVFSGDVDSNMSVGGNLSVTGTSTFSSDVDLQGSAGATLKLTSTDTTGADTELLGQIDFVSSDSSTGSAGTQARIKGVYEDNGDSSGLEFFCGASTGSGTPTLFKRMILSHDGEDPAASIITDDNVANLALISTDADASVGPVLELVRNSGSPADSDLLGSINFIGNDDGGNETTFASISTQIGDASNGTESCGLQIKAMSGGSLVSRADFLVSETVFNNGSIDLDFRVESDNNASALFVQGSNGNVGILTQAPDARLEIHDGGASSNTQLLQVHSDSTSFTSQLISIFAERNTTNSTFNAIRYFNTGASANRFIVRDSGNVENTNNSYGAISDETVKKNITDAASQWDDIKALTVRKFHLNEQDDTDPKMIGVVAQEIEKVSSGLVTTAYDEGEDRDIKTVKYSVLYMKAVKALQEAMTRIETLEAKVATLEAK